MMQYSKEPSQRVAETYVLVEECKEENDYALLSASMEVFVLSCIFHEKAERFSSSCLFVLMLCVPVNNFSFIPG